MHEPLSFNGEPGACAWDRERDPEDGADELPLAICAVCGDPLEVGDGETDDQGGLVHAECRR